MPGRCRAMLQAEALRTAERKPSKPMAVYQRYDRGPATRTSGSRRQANETGTTAFRARAMSAQRGDLGSGPPVHTQCRMSTQCWQPRRARSGRYRDRNPRSISGDANAPAELPCGLARTNRASAEARRREGAAPRDGAGDAPRCPLYFQRRPEYSVTLLEPTRTRSDDRIHVERSRAVRTDAPTRTALLARSRLRSHAPGDR